MFSVDTDFVEKKNCSETESDKAAIPKKKGLASVPQRKKSRHEIFCFLPSKGYYPTYPVQDWQPVL